MKDDNYAQCELSRGTFKTTGFIPEWAAKIGNMVELPDFDGDFWRVDSVGVVLPKGQLRIQERAFKEFQGSTRGGGIDANAS